MRRIRFPLILVGSALAVLLLLTTTGLPGGLGRPNGTDPNTNGSGAESAGLASIFVDGLEAEERIPSEHDLSRLYPDVVFRHGDPERRQVAITFDDGPDDVFTPRILDVLKRYDAPASFFLVGAMTERHLDVARRIVAEGHEIGHHGYRHVDFTKLSDAEIREQLEKTQLLFDQRLGRRPVTFRPPYSALNPRSVEVIADAGYKIILWSIDSLDWRGIKQEEILGNIVPELRPGSIILLHSAGGDLSGTVAALPLLLEELHERDLQPVTVSELLAVQ